MRVAARPVGSVPGGLCLGPRRLQARLGGRGSGPGGRVPRPGDTSPGSLPSPAGSASPASSGAAPRRLRCPQLCRVRLRRPLTGFRDPCSLIWRRSRLRGSAASSAARAPAAGHAPAPARCVLEPRPCHAHHTGCACAPRASREAELEPRFESTQEARRPALPRATAAGRGPGAPRNVGCVF